MRTNRRSGTFHKDHHKWASILHSAQQAVPVAVVPSPFVHVICPISVFYNTEHYPSRRVNFGHDLILDVTPVEHIVECCRQLGNPLRVKDFTL